MSLFSLAILVQFFVIHSVRNFAESHPSSNDRIDQPGRLMVHCWSTAFHQLDSIVYCPSSLFRCDTTRCFSYAFVCNGEFNCDDRTDEANCSHPCNTSTSLSCEQPMFHRTPLDDHASRLEDTPSVSICIARWVEFAFRKWGLINIDLIFHPDIDA